MVTLAKQEQREGRPGIATRACLHTGVKFWWSLLEGFPQLPQNSPRLTVTPGLLLGSISQELWGGPKAVLIQGDLSNTEKVRKQHWPLAQRRR